MSLYSKGWVVNVTFLGIQVTRLLLGTGDRTRPALGGKRVGERGKINPFPCHSIVYGTLGFVNMHLCKDGCVWKAVALNTFKHCFL